MRTVPLGVLIPIQQMRRLRPGEVVTQLSPTMGSLWGLCASSRGRFWCPRLPGPQFPPLGDGERVPFLPVGGAGWITLSSAPPSFFVLAAQCALAWHSRPLWAVQPGGAPARIISAGKRRSELAGPLWAAARDMCWTRAFQAWSRRTKAREEGGTKGFFTRQLKSCRLARACCAGGEGPPAIPLNPHALHSLSLCARAGASTPTPSLLLRIPLGPHPYPRQVQALNSAPRGCGCPPCFSVLRLPFSE